MDPPQDPPSHEEAKLGILSSHDVQLETDRREESGRPPIQHFSSTPAYHSPLRHHTRGTSSPRHIKETRNAQTRYSSSDQDGRAEHRINQYLIRDEIGRGSFGAVHIATDQYGKEYAVKEFSKTRLRRRAKSNLLRRPRSKLSMTDNITGAFGVRSMQRQSRQSIPREDEDNSFSLIQEEIAVMKKLNHPNLVALIEVLDDPHEDSLYMVLEMCKKGVVMKIDVDQGAEPYEEEDCRYWFRDLMLGIEYLHAQGVIHRDIKPDNCLLTEDNTLKVVDFGVSEMFDKSSEMRVTKTAGSPAFMAPELCVIRQDDVSGKAADIWSMGVTLYCLKFGKVPFKSNAVLDMYNSIINDSVDLSGECSADFKDVMLCLLEKDPKKRIKMAQLREHPWVTKQGIDPLMSAEENCSHPITEPTEAEKNAAITGNMSHLITVMKAVARFKALVENKRPKMMESILGGSGRIVQPPERIPEEESESHLHKSKSLDVSDRKPIESALVVEGVHRKIPIADDLSRDPKDISRKVFPIQRRQSDLDWTEKAPEPGVRRTTTSGRGQAHDPLEDHVYVSIGTGPGDDGEDDGNTSTPEVLAVCESPGGVDHDLFSRAYQEELERIIEDHRRKGTRASLYLTRRVENEESIRSNPNVVPMPDDGTAGPKPSLRSLIGKMATKAPDAAPEERG